MINNILKRVLSVILSILITIPLFSFEIVLAASHPVNSKLIYLEPIPGIGHTTTEDKTEMAKEAETEPTYYYSDLNRLHPWPVLRNRDHLDLGEIHLRVQYDIWNKSQNEFDITEKEEKTIYYDDVDDSIKHKYVKGAYSRADIWKNVNGKVYIWEVKPPSYKDTNKQSGLNQLERYVEHGMDESFDYGINCPEEINFADASFQFQLTLDCSNGIDEWYEYVTYNVTYEMIEKGLIVYDFTRTAKNIHI